MNKFRNKIYHISGLQNLTENLVMEELLNTVEKPDVEFCTCWICLGDVAAIVLNKIRPAYYSNFIDKEKNMKQEPELLKEIRVAIIEAFKIVHNNPHHL